MAMSNEFTARSKHEEIEMLLPFYLTERLDRADAEQVDDYLNHHPDVARQLQLIRDERAGAVAGNEALAERPANFQRVAAMIAISPAQTARRDSSLSDRIKRIFEMPSAPSLCWMGAAAAIAIIVQAAVVTTLIVTQYSETFTTASGGAGVTGAGTLAVVRFADGANTSAIVDVLTSLGMTIIDGPKGGGLFTIRLGPKDMSDVERDRTIATLKARGDLVAFVTRLP